MEESDISMKDEEKDKDNDKTSKNNELSSKNQKITNFVIKFKKRKKNDFIEGKKFFNYEFTQINFDGDKNKNDNIIKDEVKDFKVIAMDENDKMFVNIYNYLKNHTDLNINEIIMLNKEIVFAIIKLEPYYTIKKDNINYMIEKKSREIKFIDYKLKKITIKFIYNCDNLIESLKKLGFISYYVKLPKNKNDDNSIISPLNE